MGILFYYAFVGTTSVIREMDELDTLPGRRKSLRRGSSPGSVFTTGWRIFGEKTDVRASFEDRTDGGVRDDRFASSSPARSVSFGAGLFYDDDDAGGEAGSGAQRSLSPNFSEYRPRRRGLVSRRGTLVRLRGMGG